MLDVNDLTYLGNLPAVFECNTQSAVFSQKNFSTTVLFQWIVTPGCVCFVLSVICFRFVTVPPTIISFKKY